MRRIFAIALLAYAGPALANDLTEFLRSSGKPPADYLLSKAESYPVVLVGENHWLAHDSELIASIIPALRQRRIALAMEIMPAAAQGKIDQLVAADEWDAAQATEVMRMADFPYVEYREILHAVWKANRTKSDTPPMKLIGLGPPEDWRKQGIRYDEFMAQRLIDYSGDERRHVLAYVGMHHAFTRYLQAERRINGRTTEFMNRFGNILWRHYGQDVFLIALHKPEWCGPPDAATSQSCMPFGGALDCAAAELGHSVAFDVVGSPVAELKFAPSSFYALGNPLLRLYDYADGYVWSETPDQTTGVHVIPLGEYTPDKANDPEAIAAWKKLEARMAHPYERTGFDRVASWRNDCASQAAANSGH